MAVALDISANSGVQAAVSSFSFNITVGTLTNGIIVVSVQARDTVTTNYPVTGLTYNTVALTKVAGASGNHDFGGGTCLNSEMWQLVNPASGTHSVAVTLTGSTTDVTAVATTFSGVNQSTPIDASNSTSQPTVSSSSISITTVAANAMIVDSLYTNSDNAMTIGAGQTQDANLQPHSAGDQSGSSHKLATTAGSYAMSWTGLQAGSAVQTSVLSLLPASVSATFTPRRTLIGVGF